MKTFCAFSVLYEGKDLICPIDSFLAVMLIWVDLLPFVLNHAVLLARCGADADGSHFLFSY